MVGIQCPHCGKTVELEHGAYGLFECPYCDGEFEYESSNSPAGVHFVSKPGLNMTSKTGLVLLVASICSLIGGYVLFNNAMSDFDDTSTECDEALWIDNFGEDRGCSTEGDYGFGAFCCGGLLILVGLGVGISAIISLITGALSRNQYVVLNQK